MPSLIAIDNIEGNGFEVTEIKVNFSKNEFIQYIISFESSVKNIRFSPLFYKFEESDSNFY